MTIDRLGPVEPIQPGNKTNRVNRADESSNLDTVNISSAAQERAGLQRVQELAASAPDTRAERVAELRERINDPSYLDDKIVRATADRLIDALFG